tara:strand:+ start:29906 stop:30067 length:162 start_codon:yes stop_codon:yes gene_type:complete
VNNETKKRIALGFSTFVKKPIKNGFFKLNNELFGKVFLLLYLVFINDIDKNNK